MNSVLFSNYKLLSVKKKHYTKKKPTHKHSRKKNNMHTISQHMHERRESLHKNFSNRKCFYFFLFADCAAVVVFVVLYLITHENRRCLYTPQTNDEDEYDAEVNKERKRKKKQTTRQQQRDEYCSSSKRKDMLVVVVAYFSERCFSRVQTLLGLPFVSCVA